MKEPELTFDQIAQLIPWESKLISLVPSIQERLYLFNYTVKYYENLMAIEDHLKICNVEKQTEILHSLIYFCKEELYNIEVRANDHFLSETKLKKKVKNDYQHGLDLKLSHYADEICDLMRIGYNDYKSCTSLEESFKAIFHLYVKNHIIGVIQLIDLHKFLSGKLGDVDPNAEFVAETTVKLKWLGTPAQLAFVLDLLQKRGFLDGLTGRGERNAKIALSHFDVVNHNPSIESLGKNFKKLIEGLGLLNPDDTNRFNKFPERNDLKK